jgi:hypothetical protein
MDALDDAACGSKNNNNSAFQFLLQNNHPIELNTAIVTWQKLDYLHHNPLEAGFVCWPEDYLYSSVVDYYTEGKGLIEIIRIDLIVRFPV